ncbi:hypothetical protein CEE37_02905 [candidate division LCP-89 bacterium B3_LCP]|uniref:DUF494 domain-containing protein n=1 Tax=candidate division LCP-89 bacterium B3_LCP TaxID=2012998 RepID=A0A532V309_UNCL8|nr:MAG: hypothetical protein CEE37_02905 [candidate division LCP-89 bacterium B3_LCP]
MEILVLLMDEFGDDKWQFDHMDQVSEDLIQRGYTEQEINTAFYWLYNRFGWEDATPPYSLHIDDATGSSYRVLHPQEQRLITPESYGFLLQLSYLKLISPRDIEEVIERVAMLDLKSATVDEIKPIIQSILFEENNMWGNKYKGLNLSQKGETYH